MPYFDILLDCDPNTKIVCRPYEADVVRFLWLILYTFSTHFLKLYTRLFELPLLVTHLPRIDSVILKQNKDNAFGISEYI